MTIRFNPTFIENASPLEIALTIIHETIHAELLDRAIQIGAIQTISQLGHIIPTGTSTSYEIQDVIFNHSLFFLWKWLSMEP